MMKKDKTFINTKNFALMSSENKRAIGWNFESKNAFVTSEKAPKSSHIPYPYCAMRGPCAISSQFLPATCSALCEFIRKT